VTDWSVLYVPAIGEYVMTGTWNAYAAEAMLLGDQPDLNVMALSVAGLVTFTVPPDDTLGSDDVGSTPFVV
jgi:hypothetical protein